MLHKPAQDISKAERNIGKAGELACGFGGSVGAWRRIATDDQRSDEQIRADVYAWRQAHLETTTYWRELARAIRIAIRTGRPAVAGRIVAGFADENLTLMLPSGRQITYPQARLVPSSKFEDGDPDVLFKDNAHGKWADYRGWFGTFVENVVQGTARDLLAAAIERFEVRGIELVLTVHDEVVAELPSGSISEADFLSILLEAPAWADGLPLAGKVWSGSHYLEPPEEPTKASDSPRLPEAPREGELEAELDAAIDAIPVERVKAATTVFDDDAAEDDMPPLFDLVSVQLTADHKTSCPFHAGDDNPSLQFYTDHFHCFGCGARGSRVDWLVQGEGMSREEAIAFIRDWEGPVHLSARRKTRRRSSHARSVYGRKQDRSLALSPNAISLRPDGST